MNANQRRPGFRLPWSPEDGPGSESSSDAPPTDGSAPTTPATPPVAASEPANRTAASGPATPGAPSAIPDAATAEPGVNVDAPAAEPPADAKAAKPTADAATGGLEPAAETPAPEPVPADDTGDDFMRDLVSAMRRVAEEARDSGLADLRGRADEQVSLLEADAERRREDLRARAETDVDAVGEWAKAEADRITREAEQRVVARRSQLDQQLAGDTQRTEADTRALRERVSEYERELAAYHGQLSEIKDPAAFAAAAKRMPKAPQLAPPAAPPATQPSAAQEPTATGSDDVPVEPSIAGSNGVPTLAAEVHPAEEEVLAARLAQLDATLPAAGAPSAGAATTAEPTTTEVVVKGLGSFGAITGFRQSLSAVEGVDGVALSLGQTGEFVFRATHPEGFDVRAAIVGLEGDAAKIEDRPEGGLRVTLERAR